MKIGELSKRSEVPVRMLRYYEERGLLRPHRSTNGYRQYSEDDVERTGLISSLIRSGLTTKLIISMLHGDDAPDSAGDDLVELLIAEREKLQSKIACMTLSRNTIDTHLARLTASGVQMADVGV